MRIQRFRIGNNLSVIWLLYEDDGNIHTLEGKELELYMTCGGFKYPVTDYTITENAIAWVFPAAVQTKTGYYKLVLLERDPVRGLYSFDVADAFCLEPKDALTNIRTIVDEDATVQVRSVLTYAHITNLASVDTVTTDEGNVAVIHLTNGKTFNIPLGSGGGEGGGGSVDVIDNLNSHNPNDALSANQGRVLKEMIEAITHPTVVDNLNSESTTDPLSANMGRELKRLIDNIPGGGGGGGGGSVDIVDNLTEGGRNKALSAEQGKVLKELLDQIPGSTSDSIVQTMYSSSLDPGTPATNAQAWHSARASADTWLAIRFREGASWGEWTVIFIGDIDLPYSTFKSFAFTRSNDSSVAAPTGGSYASPVPTTTGWSDGIPAGTGKIWMSTRTFASDDTHSDASWSTPREVADSEYMDYEFSSVENPGTPGKSTPSSANTNPNWSNTAGEGTIWMAMREVSNGAYKSGSSWMIVKIKGEDGKDGTSVNIKGTVPTAGDLPTTGNTAGDGYLVNGDLYVWDGDSWVNAGPIKGEDGEDGQTPFIHIKYSNDGGLHFTANDGETPGDYIGLYWDYNAQDSDNVADYTWKSWKGEDGFGYEYIFKLTANGTAPSAPSSSPNTDDYVPDGWTDDAAGVTSNLPFCWVSWRKKEDGVWGSWNTPRIFSHYGKDGTNGSRGQAQFKSIVFKRSATQPSLPGTGTNKYGTSPQDGNGYTNSNYGGEFESPVPYGWSDGVPAPTSVSDPDSLDNTLWVTWRVFTDDGQSPQYASWRTPVRANDTDDVDIEFAYQQTNDATPATPVDSNRHGGSGTQVWFDPVQDRYDGSVLRDFTQMFWMAVRHKVNGVGVGAWAILRIKGEKGTDGVDGKDAKPIRIRKWSDVSYASLSGNAKVFSGYEDGAPFRDVLIVTKNDYPDGTSYPWTDSNTAVPVLVTINYNSSYESGFPGSYFTSSRLPQSGNYTNTLPASKTESASATAQGDIWSTFANLGAIYIQLLVATQAYIGGLTVDHLTTNAGNNSYINIDDGFICFYDTNGNLRAKMGQGSGDSSPVLKFYASDGTTVLYDLGPNGIRLLGVSVYPETWTPVRFWKHNSLPSVGSTYQQSNGASTWLNQYTCARRTVNNVVEYYVNGSWQNSASPNEGKYFEGRFKYPGNGYYVIDNLGWVNAGSAQRALVVRVSGYGTSSVTEQFGHIDLVNLSDSGTSGTIDKISWD